LLKIHIIPNLTLLPEVCTASTVFPTASAGLLLEVPMALAASNVPDLGARLVSSVEVVAASIQHLEEVLTTSYLASSSVLRQRFLSVSSGSTATFLSAAPFFLSSTG
jgi:hypothetical protein